MSEKQKIYVNGLFLEQEMTGVQKFAFAICQEMSKLDVEIVFLCPGSIKKTPSFGSIKKFGKLNGHLWEQITLPLYLKRKKIKTYLNLCNSAPLFSSGHILCIHDLSFHNSRKWFSRIYSYAYKFLTPQIIKKAKKVITVSGFSKKQISNTYSIKPEKIQVVYNGIYFNDNNQVSDGSLTNEKYMLFVGSLSPRKNLSMLIEAIDEMAPKDLNLFVIGKKNKIYKKEKSLESPYVKFLEQTNDTDLQNLYKNAKMLVMPSLYEGFGLPILEALSFNCPVICSDIPVFRELFENHVTFFDLKSKEDLKQKISLILRNKIQIKVDTKELVKKYNYSNGAKIVLDVVNN